MYWSSNNFLIDSPRISIILDNVKIKKKPTETFFYLHDFFDKSTFWNIIESCTQSWLCEWYKEGIDLFQSSPEIHLLDDGRQINTISTDNNLVHIFKPFRLVQIEDDMVDTIKLVELKVVYNPKTDICVDNKWTLKENNWIMV